MSAKYVFLHIPKTAGTSIYRAFQQIFGSDQVTDQFVVSNISSQEASLLDRYKMISGHISWEDVAKSFQERKKITFLRDPLDRCISWYYFARSRTIERVIPLKEIKNANCSQEAISLAKQLSLEDCLSSEHPHILQNLQNRQTWQIAAHAATSSRTIKDAAALELAKQHIKKIEYVGFYETLQEDFNRFVKQSGLAEGWNLGHENRTNERPQRNGLSDAVVRRLEALNNLDMALYDYAKSENF